jgi:RNA polymerase sigma-70 factor (sigma-E family)
MTDDETYKDFVVARYPTMVRAAVLFGCRAQDAEDAVQDALVRCYTAWSRVSSADDPDAYAFRVLINTIARSRRRRWWGELPHAELPEAQLDDDVAVVVSLNQSVRSALERLTPPQREVLVLRYFVDLSEAQIARVLGVAVGTVKSRASRAVAALAGDPSLTNLLFTLHEED